MSAFWSRTVGRVPAPRARARPRVALCTLSLASLGRTVRIGALSKDLEGLSLKACLLLQQINPEKHFKPLVGGNLVFWGLQSLEGAAEAPLTSRVISLCLKVFNYWVRDSILRSRSSASLKPAPARSLTRPPRPKSGPPASQTSHTLLQKYPGSRPPRAVPPLPWTE